MPLAGACHRNRRKKAHQNQKRNHSDFSVLLYPVLAKLNSVPAGSEGLFPGPAPGPQSRAEKGRFGGKGTALITDTEGFGGEEGSY